jgi:CheY-like chemotaxis protein
MRTTTRETGTALVMHDDVWVRSQVAATLGQAGYTVLAASNGASGVRLAEQHQPEVIVLSTALPELSGPAVLERLHDCPITRDIPVLMMSSSAAECQAPAHTTGSTAPERVSLGRLLPELSRALAQSDPQLAAR